MSVDHVGIARRAPEEQPAPRQPRERTDRGPARRDGHAPLVGLGKPREDVEVAFAAATGVREKVQQAEHAARHDRRQTVATTRALPCRAVSPKRKPFSRRPDDSNVRARAQREEYLLAADRIAAGPGRDVLDWGCGLGLMTELLDERGLNVTTMDYDDAITEIETRALKEFPDREATFTPDPVNLPYPDASFDVVLSMGVLEHVGDPEGSLDEIARVLRPGGTLHCYKLPNRASYLEAIAKRLGWYYHGQCEFDRLYTLDSAEAMFRAHGYELLEARRANMLPLTLTSPAAQRLAPLTWRASRGLSRVPGLNHIATNVELIARRP